MDHIRDGSAGNDFAGADVNDTIAALGLIHVMGADQDGEPFLGQAVNLFPKFAPCLRVYACCGLVEKQ